MAINFPNSPVVDEVFAVVGGPTWQYTGTTWKLLRAVTDDGAAIVTYTPEGTGAVTTTVKAALDGLPSINVANMGVLGDGSDESVNILKVIAHAKTLGGATIYFPPGNYGTTAELLIDSSNIILTGVGASFMTATSPHNQQYATRFVALAGFPSGKAVARFTPTAGDAFPLHNVGMTGIQVDCADIAEHGVWATSIRNFVYKDSSVFQPVLVGFQLDVIGGAGTTWTGGNRATKHFIIDNILIRVGDTNVDARGIVFDGPSDNSDAQNVNLGWMGNVYVQHKNGVGIDLHDIDTVHFGRISTWTAGTGRGVRCNGTSKHANHYACRDNLFDYLQCTGFLKNGGGGLEFTTGDKRAAFNTVTMYSRANSTPPVIYGWGCSNQVNEESNEPDSSLRDITVSHSTNPAVRMLSTNPVVAASKVGEVSGWGYNETVRLEFDSAVTVSAGERLTQATTGATGIVVDDGTLTDENVTLKWTQRLELTGAETLIAGEVLTQATTGATGIVVDDGDLTDKYVTIGSVHGDWAATTYTVTGSTTNALTATVAVAPVSWTAGAPYLVTGDIGAISESVKYAWRGRAEFLRMEGHVLDPTPGSEDSRADLYVMVAGTLTKLGSFTVNGLTLFGTVAPTYGVQYPVLVTANLEDINHAVNTTNKAIGVTVYNNTTKALHVAMGSATTSVWRNQIDNSTTAVPS